MAVVMGNSRRPNWRIRTMEGTAAQHS